MGVVHQEPGQYDGQISEEVGGQGEDHLGIHHDTQLVVSVGQVGHGRFFKGNISLSCSDHS